MICPPGTANALTSDQSTRITRTAGGLVGGRGGEAGGEAVEAAALAGVSHGLRVRVEGGDDVAADRLARVLRHAGAPGLARDADPGAARR